MIEPAWITAGAAVAGVLVALWAAINGLRTVRQLRFDSRERSRPMMAAELRKAPYVPGTQLLVIRNYGPSIARNVQVTFNPPIPEPTPEHAATSVSPFLTRRYAESIPVVTPGMELSNIWFSGRIEGNLWVNVEPTPDKFSVTIAYDGPDCTHYDDRFPLDTDLIRGHTYVSSSGEPENRLKEVAKSLAQIAKSLTRITRSVTPPSDESVKGLSDADMRALLGDRWQGRQDQADN